MFIYIYSWIYILYISWCWRYGERPQSEQCLSLSNLPQVTSYISHTQVKFNLTVAWAITSSNFPNAGLAERVGSVISLSCPTPTTAPQITWTDKRKLGNQHPPSRTPLPVQPATPTNRAAMLPQQQPVLSRRVQTLISLPSRKEINMSRASSLQTFHTIS